MSSVREARVPGSRRNERRFPFQGRILETVCTAHSKVRAHLHAANSNGLTGVAEPLGHRTSYADNLHRCAATRPLQSACSIGATGALFGEIVLGVGAGATIPVWAPVAVGCGAACLIIGGGKPGGGRRQGGGT